MRSVALLLFAAAAAAVEVHDSFNRWMQQHGKSYATSVEYEHRRGIWESSRAFVKKHNTEAAKGLHTFRTGLNRFSDMTNDEYRTMVLGFRSKSNVSVEANAPTPPLLNAPDSVDWRQAGIVPDVKNQENCGSCWAFSAVAAMEAAFNQHANGTVPKACTTKCGPKATPCCSFSEQELVDCTDGGKDTCKEGGDMPSGVSEIVKQMKGVMDTEAQYPYSSGSGDSPGVCHAKAGGVVTGFSGYTQVKMGDENDLQLKALQSVVAIAIDASQPSFQHYSDGVYNEPNCKNDQDSLDHGVSIVGYGVLRVAPIPASCTAALKTQCGGAKGAGAAVCNGCCMAAESDLKQAGCTEDSWESWCQEASGIVAPREDVPYWTVRNSWGPNWGMDGYVLMSRNKKNQCGVASAAIVVNTGSLNEVLV